MTITGHEQAWYTLGILSAAALPYSVIKYEYTEFRHISQLTSFEHEQEPTALNDQCLACQTDVSVTVHSYEP